MVLEFLNEEDAISAFDFSDKNLNKFGEHPLFINIEIHKYPRPPLFEYMICRYQDPFDIYICYYSGIENKNVERRIEVRRYKNIIRLIPEESKYKWIANEIVDLFINKEYKILGE